MLLSELARQMAARRKRRHAELEAALHGMKRHASQRGCGGGEGGGAVDGTAGSRAPDGSVSAGQECGGAPGGLSLRRRCGVVQLELRKLRLLDLQARLRKEVEQEQQSIATMPERQLPQSGRWASGAALEGRERQGKQGTTWKVANKQLSMAKAHGGSV
eukprot:352333-Chlamydomonas_euryale.AAC.3